MRSLLGAFRVGPVHTLEVARRYTCPTFVGREEELVRLDAAAQMATVAGQLVVVAGDAGIGKTRLIEEAASRWRAGGGAAVIGGCVDLSGLGAGYAPLLEVLRAMRTELDATLVDQLLRDSAPELLPLLTGGYGAHAVRQDAVLAHTLALLVAVGDHSPGLVVVFEDLHWADPSTRDLIAFLTRNLRAAKVALVLTYRIDDLHRRHPLRPLLAELSRSPAVEQLTLRGMTRSELTVLLTGVAGAVPSDALVDEVLVRSDGNPFFAEELFAAGAGSVPATLRDVMLAHLAALPDEAQATLRDAAVLGAAIDGRVLALMTGRSTADVADALREGVARNVLVAEADGCRFRHALVREALYMDVLAGERQLLHEAAATVIDAHPELVSVADHVRWALLAHHWGAAEDQPNAFAASVRAALAAENVGALADAVAHYQRALELWSRVPAPESAAGMSRSDLLVRAAEATAHAGSPAGAVSLVEAALKLLEADAEPERRASLLERLGNHRWVACDTVGSGQAREEAVAMLADRPPSVAKALALAALGRHQMLVDRFVAAQPTLRQAIEIATIAGSSTARASALSGLGFTLAKLGHLEEGVDAGREALATALRDGTADDVGRAYVNLTATFLAATRCEEAAQVAIAGIEHARRVGMLGSDGVLLAYNGADALYWLGQWDEAMALVTAYPLLADRPYGTSGAVVVARIAFLRGHDELSAHHRDLALAATHAGAERAPEALACAAQIAAREGRFDDARRNFADALAIVDASDDLFLATQISSAAMEVEADRVESIRLHGSHSPAEASEAQVVADGLRTWARRAVERLARQGVPLGRDASVQLAVLEAECARVSGEFDPDRWASIAAQWDALHFAYPVATARYREAEAVLRGRGGRDRAAAAARAALATAERLGAAPLAARVRLLAERGRVDLTAPAEDRGAPRDVLSQRGVSTREREVLDLIAAGRTNRQIAHELYISEKTASVHVTHLLRKLGVGTRIEAAAIAQELRNE
ncbi:MAG: hypothetical protein QOG44_3094 [Acidimicrobiaceae bacterium]|nr:hypothetical protein [Acidimicrobiaceae bacterium]